MPMRTIYDPVGWVMGRASVL